MIKRACAALGAALVLGGLVACESQPSLDFDRLSPAMQAERITTDTHQHLVIRRLADNSTDALHVYIEGDGLPWIRRYFVARDPTPRHTLALSLMEQDRASDTLYLGRPCYFNTPRYGLNDANCHPSLWTSRRYSEAVVSSMAQALTQAADLSSYRRVVLIGHSGGGSLALLLGQRLAGEVDLVVTIAANLDTEAWTRHHGFSPLFGSLNPLQELTPGAVAQVHWAGARDDVAPPALHQDALAALGYPLRVEPSFDHNCCWLQSWPSMLYRVIAEQEGAAPKVQPPAMPRTGL